MKKVLYYLFDFDSTLIKLEALEQVGNISLIGNPKKNKILRSINTITRLGMEGKIKFTESLEKRLRLLTIHKSHIEQVVTFLKNEISTSIYRNLSFFKTHKERVFVISGGFKEYIIPIVELLGIKPTHVLANEFIFNTKGYVEGFDKSNSLSYSHGKVNAALSLGLKGIAIMIGDGYTDYEVVKMKAADYFIAYAENVYRKTIMNQADKIVYSFEELKAAIKEYETNLHRG